MYMCYTYFLQFVVDFYFLKGISERAKTFNFEGIYFISFFLFWLIYFISWEIFAYLSMKIFFMFSFYKFYNSSFYFQGNDLFKVNLGYVVS